MKSVSIRRRLCSAAAQTLLMAAVCGAIALALAAPAVAAPEGRLGTAKEKQAIESAYRTLARYAAASGHEFGVRLTAFRTIEPAEFSRVRWWDLVTPPGGDMIDMTRSTHAFQGVLDAVTYVPKWQLDGPTYLRPDAPPDVTEATVADVLSDRAAKMPETAEAIAITSYRVEVHLDGYSRAYQAAAVWFPLDDTGGARVSFVDHITQGVDKVILERPVRRRPQAPFVPGLAKTSQCEQSSQVELKQKHDSDNRGHIDGNHFAFAEAAFKCDCRSDCYGSCEADFRQRACEDSGSIEYLSCHAMTTASDLGSASKGDASPAGGGGPACGAGFQCLAQNCYFCWCGAAASVTVYGAQVQFGAGNGATWAGNLDLTHECAPCTPYSPTGGGVDGPFHLDPNPGGTPPGDGGWSCCQWATDCWVDGNGVYTCRISNRCAVYC